MKEKKNSRYKIMPTTKLKEKLYRLSERQLNRSNYLFISLASFRIFNYKKLNEAKVIHHCMGVCTGAWTVASCGI